MTLYYIILHYITLHPLYLFYNWKFFPFDYFQFPHFWPAVSSNHQLNLFFHEFVFFFNFFWIIINLQLRDICSYTIHNIVICYFFMLQNYHYNKPCYLSPCKDVISNYISHSVHFIPVTHLFSNCKFVPLNICHLFHFSPHPFLLWQPLVCLYCIYDSVSVLCLFICFVFCIPHKSEIIWYLSFSFLFISLSMISF